MSLSRPLRSYSTRAASAWTTLLGIAASSFSPPTSSLVEDKILLMLPPKEAKHELGVYRWQDRCFYDLAEKDFVTSKLRLSRLQEEPLEIVGSSHGWLACLRPSDGCSLSLVKPSAKAADTIRDLPPLDTLPDFASKSFRCMDYDGTVKKIVALPKFSVDKIVISDPKEGNCTAVMITGSAKSKLSVCRIGEKKWTNLETDRYLGDVVYSSRDKLFYAIKNEHFPEVEVWDLKNRSSPKKKTLKFPPFPAKLDPRRRTRSSDTISRYYSVESLGNILLVRRHFAFHLAEDGTVLEYREDPKNQLPYGTFGFDVLKLNKNGGEFQLMNCLDDQALFLGFNHSFAVSATKFPGVQGNSIYFGDHLALRGPEFSRVPFGGHDFGIFNLEDGSIKPCFPTESKKFPYPPVWFAPSPDFV